MPDQMFYFEPSGVLAEYVEPKRGEPYTHRCTEEVFEEVCHLIDELDSFTLDELVEGRDLPNSQVSLAMRFLHEYGLIEKVHPRRNRRTEDSIHLSAMTCWHGLREGGLETQSGGCDGEQQLQPQRADHELCQPCRVYGEHHRCQKATTLGTGPCRCGCPRSVEGQALWDRRHGLPRRRGPRTR